MSILKEKAILQGQQVQEGDEKPEIKEQKPDKEGKDDLKGTGAQENPYNPTDLLTALRRSGLAERNLTATSEEDAGTMDGREVAAELANMSLKGKGKKKKRR